MLDECRLCLYDVWPEIIAPYFGMLTVSCFAVHMLANVTPRVVYISRRGGCRDTNDDALGTLTIWFGL